MAIISFIFILRYPLLGRRITILYQAFLIASVFLYGIVGLLISTPLEGFKMLSFSALLIIWLYVFAFGRSSKRYFDYYKD